jgi:hypothetical protein
VIDLMLSDISLRAEQTPVESEDGLQSVVEG